MMKYRNYNDQRGLSSGSEMLLTKRGTTAYA